MKLLCAIYNSRSPLKSIRRQQGACGHLVGDPLNYNGTFSRTLQHSASYKARKQEILDYVVITIKVLFLESLQRSYKVLDALGLGLAPINSILFFLHYTEYKLNDILANENCYQRYIAI